MPNRARPETLRKQVIWELFKVPRADAWARIGMSLPFWILALIPALCVFGLTLFIQTPMCRPDLTLHAYHWACIALSFISAWAFLSSMRIAFDFAANPALAQRASEWQDEHDSLSLRSQLEQEIIDKKEQPRETKRL